MSEHRHAAVLGNDAAASDGLADTSMLTDAEEYVTVHGDGFNNSYYIRKSYLIEASGFFKKMFEHDYQETMNGEIHLHEDDPVALEVVLNHLHIQSMACGPMESSSIHASWHSLAFRNEPCPLARYAITDAQEYLETIVGLYLIADKYDMPVVRTMCAECSLSNSIDGLLLAFGDGNNEQPDSTLKEGDVLVFKQKFFDVICDRLGDYPEDLFGLFYDFVEQSLEEGCDTKVMFEACAQYPRLSVYVSTTLANTLRTANRQSLENANRAAGYRQELGRVKRLVANVSEVLVTYN